MSIITDPGPFILSLTPSSRSSTSFDERVTRRPSILNSASWAATLWFGSPRVLLSSPKKVRRALSPVRLRAFEFTS